MTPEDLVEIEDIKGLKHRYARFLDTKRFEELAELFVPNATAAYGGGAYSFEGRDAIMGFLTGALGSPDVLTSHTTGQSEIELLGSGRARGTWALQDVVILTALDLVVRGASYYEDEYVKVDGSWRFQHTGYRRVWEEMSPRSPEVTLTATWFVNDGRSSLPGPS